MAEIRLGSIPCGTLQRIKEYQQKSHYEGLSFFLGSLKSRSPIKVQDAIAGNECLRNDIVSFLLKLLRQNGYLSEAENSK